MGQQCWLLYDRWAELSLKASISRRSGGLAVLLRGANSESSGLSSQLIGINVPDVCEIPERLSVTATAHSLNPQPLPVEVGTESGDAYKA